MTITSTFISTLLNMAIEKYSKIHGSMPSDEKKDSMREELQLSIEYEGLEVAANKIELLCA
ncbi:MAG: hypothetical protein IKQ56_07160 [Lachnospiraceae bacterium]|nr:hypothetical protein [Lachnospiraceae bacterium]MCR4945692.1 hypothetical protein [Lachnospiraceae bacterium]